MFTTADKRLARFASEHHSVFTIANARKAGLSHHQVDYRVANAWIHVHDGVYRMPGSSPTWKSALLAATLAATAPAAISHRSAAALYGLRAVETTSSSSLPGAGSDRGGSAW